MSGQESKEDVCVCPICGVNAEAHDRKMWEACKQAYLVDLMRAAKSARIEIMEEEKG